MELEETELREQVGSVTSNVRQFLSREWGGEGGGGGEAEE